MSDDKKATMGHLTFGPGMGGMPPTATNEPITIDASQHFCAHGRLWTRDCDKCDAERDDKLRAETRQGTIAEVCEWLLKLSGAYKADGAIGASAMLLDLERSLRAAKLDVAERPR